MSESPRPTAVLARQHRARRRIDRVDAALIELLARRVAIAAHLAELRASAGLERRDPQREAELLADRRRAAQEAGLAADDVEAVFVAVMRLTRHAQQRSRGSEGDGG